ncbi:MAG: Dickkopf N-terminal cysteine-rich domain-containing protein [Myxococcota bacterium]
MLTMATNDNGSCGIPDAGEAECQATSDCAGLDHKACAGEWGCDQGVCTWTCDQQPPACRDDNACATGQACRDGVCVDVPVDQGCYTDSECGQGQHCNAAEVCHTPPGCNAGDACPAVCYGECVDGDGDTCYVDADCKDGYYCGFPDFADAAGAVAMRSGVCLPKQGCSADEQCGPGEACVNGACQVLATECYGDADCGDGYHCVLPDSCLATDGGAADPADPNGNGARPAPPMCAGQCAPNDPQTCADGTQCPRGTHCEDVCEVPPTCDCADGSSDCGCAMPAPACTVQCVRDTVGCQSDSECGQDEYCSCGGTEPAPFGVAVLVCECLPKQTECKSDDQCAAGQKCEIVGCTEGAGCDPSADPSCDADKMPVPVDNCWGYCVDAGCQDDSQCGAGYYCNHDNCGATDPASGERPVMCPGVCEPITNGECKGDADCGAFGRCVTVCEGPAGADFAPPPPCDDPNGNCDPMPPPPPQYCKNVCEYEQPQSCDPADPNTCGEGTHCEMTCGGVLPNGLVVACPYLCVPDQGKCESNCDCPSGEQCTNGTCLVLDPLPCDANGACPDGMACGCGGRPGDPSTDVACFPQCRPVEPQCCKDSDCGDGSQCVDGACQAWYCGNGADTCPDGYECTSTCPVPTPANGLVVCLSVCTPKAQACSSDCDCSPDQACLAGECTVANRINECYPNGCLDDSWCAPGELCALACPGCAAGSTNCPPCQGFCVAQPECKSDADCGDGQYCVLDSYTETCPCADGSCDAPCAVVSAGYCAAKPPTGCAADSDCKDGQTCHMYYPPCAACPVDDAGKPIGPCPNCGPYGVCEDVTPPDPGTCKSDVDCATGEHCDLSVCPMFIPCLPDGSGGCGGCSGQCVVNDPTPTSCVVSGCSGQICAEQPMASTCEWKPWYACYKLAKCEDQAEGRCGWTPNDEFNKCMQDNGGFGTATPQ